MNRIYPLDNTRFIFLNVIGTLQLLEHGQGSQGACNLGSGVAWEAGRWQITLGHHGDGDGRVQVATGDTTGDGDGCQEACSNEEGIACQQDG